MGPREQARADTVYAAMSSHFNIIDHKNGRRFDFDGLRRNDIGAAGDDVLDALYYTELAQTRAEGETALVERVVAYAGRVAGEAFCRALVRRVWQFCERAGWEIEVCDDLYLNYEAVDAFEPEAAYRLRLRELDNFPSDPAERTPMEEIRLDALIVELDDLYRALTPEQQQVVDAPRK